MHLAFFLCFCFARLHLAELGNHEKSLDFVTTYGERYCRDGDHLKYLTRQTRQTDNIYFNMFSTKIINNTKSSIVRSIFVACLCE